ncbi:restriction endonuclease subunit S [Campylobacter concisus]|uniref:restriction endonuclease subunit S n=2 Tax=Campylobacter concisus TaxID=199 RepID=UPI000CD97D98|nr:restriction endonuclease subunit S [Campylobacter concisus]
MSKIFDLINELCPDGVEFRELGEICEFNRGKFLSKSDKDLGDIPMILYGELYTTYGDYISRIISCTSMERAQKASVATFGDILLPISSTTKEAQIGKASALMTKMPVYIGGDALILSHNQNPGFLVYCLNSKKFEKEKMKCVSGTTITHLSPSKLAKIKLPVPPMEVQREIVRILDSFTSLTEELMAKLTEELTARKKQYEFYRDFLLSFDELDKNGGGCELKMLGEICDLIAGGDISKDKVSKEKDIKFKFPIYSNGIGDNALYGFTDEPRVMKQCVTISARGTIGYCALRLDPFYPIVRLICAIPKSNITAQFLKYFLDTQKISVPTSGIPQLTIPMVAKIKIPVPSLQTQQKVVEILDKFDTLVNSITEGLPREIELRRKQYEHYRELLLNFKPKMTA